MNLPFTPEQFLGVFAEYNAALWSVVVAFWLASLGVLVVTWRKPAVYSRAGSVAVWRGFSRSQAWVEVSVGRSRGPLVRRSDLPGATQLGNRAGQRYGDWISLKR